MRILESISRFSKFHFNRLKMFFIFTILTVAIISCKESNQVVIPEIQFLQMKDSSCHLDRCYYSAMIYDSLLILTSDCDSNYFHLFNKTTLEPILSFGTRGKGPTDFSTPIPFKTNSLIEAPSTTIEYYNLNSPIISSINFLEIIHNMEISSCINSNIIDPDLFMNIELNKINNNEIAGINIAEPYGLFYIYNLKTKSKTWVDFSPKFKSFDESLTSVIYSGSLCSNTKVLAFANKFFDEISFYYIDGKLLKKYNFSEIRKPIINYGNKESKMIDLSSNIYFAKSYFFHAGGLCSAYYYDGAKQAK